MAVFVFSCLSSSSSSSSRQITYHVHEPNRFSRWPRSSLGQTFLYMYTVTINPLTVFDEYTRSKGAASTFLGNDEDVHIPVVRKNELTFNDCHFVAI